MDLFSLKRITELTGVQYESLVLWQTAGILVPTQVKQGKKRQMRFFSRQVLFGCAVAASLIRLGVCGQPLRKALRFLCRADLDGRIAAGFPWLVIATDGSVHNAADSATFHSKVGLVGFASIHLPSIRKAFADRLTAHLEKSCASN